MNKTQLRSTLLLLFGSLIWGSAFVAQSVGMDYVGPFTFNAVRCLVGTLVLIPCILFIDHWKKKKGLSSQNPVTKEEKKTFLMASLICGIALFAATTFQQVGLVYTTVGKAGFITAMYIVLVPVLNIFLHKKAGLRIWICILVAVVGLYFLCITEDFTIQKGDLLMLGAAFMFAIQILAISHYAPKVDNLRLSASQFLVTGLISLVIAFLVETPILKDILSAWQSILYAGVLSCGVAYTLQIIAEKDADPAIASLAMSMESVFSLLAGWLVLGQMLNTKEFIGSGLMFLAIIVSQLPGKKKAVS